MRDKHFLSLPYVCVYIHYLLCNMLSSLCRERMRKRIPRNADLSSLYVCVYIYLLII